jgi:nicotinate-nucleotide pyrophosphorylase (carboxylating)
METNGENTGKNNHHNFMPGIQKLIETALLEDIGSGDITTDNLIPPDEKGKGVIIAKEQLVIAGIHIAHQVFTRLDQDILFSASASDGDVLNSGDIVAEIEGRLCTLLKGERTALNFLQRLSGIATHVKSFANLLENKRVRLVDTRKTTPGWRVLEKYAVKVGGAFNHRTGLFDGVLIKDNHIKACSGIGKAVARIRESVSHLVKIEVEVSNSDEVKEALEAGADVIMLDNMDIEEIRESVKLIDGRAVVEVSGMVTKKELVPLSETGVDIISAGALTHSAKAVDLSMRIL